MIEVSKLQQLQNELNNACANVEYENRLRRRAIDELREADKRTAELREQLERERCLRIGAEEQASRAIARLASVVETVRSIADNMRRSGEYEDASVARRVAEKLQRMELP